MSKALELIAQTSTNLRSISTEEIVVYSGIVAFTVCIGAIIYLVRNASYSYQSGQDTSREKRL